MMKKIFIPIAALMFFTGAIYMGCQSSGQKVDDAQSKVQDAKQDLKVAQQDAAADAQKAKQMEEQKAFRSMSEAKIDSNETRIAELKDKIKTSGKKLNALYSKNIEALEQKNKDLKTKIDNYDGQSDWESFKREFNHDMAGLGQSLKDFTVNNK